MAAEPAGPSGRAVILYGPTASGKSALAVKLAERLDGVVINADALQLYAELPILTARPDRAAEASAPHRLYGAIAATQRASAAWWRQAALDEIAAAARSGRLPILVGGTGLYIKALIDGLSPVPPTDPEARARGTALYESLGGSAFHRVLAQRDPEIAGRLAPGDRQRLIRAFEVVESTGTPLSRWQCAPRLTGHALRFTLIGLLPERAALYRRIDARFLRMIEEGGLDEARRFGALALDPTLPANRALGLEPLRRHLDGALPLDAAIAQGQQHTRNYAKRQMTWFRHQIGAPDNVHMTHAENLEFSESELDGFVAFIRRGD